MGNVIIKLPSGGGNSMDLSDATAAPSDVTKGKIFYGSDGRAIGTHALTDDLQDGNAVPSDVFRGKTFYNKNGRQVGTFSMSNANALPEDVASGKGFYNKDGYTIGKNPIMVRSDKSSKNTQMRANLALGEKNFLVIKETAKNVFELSAYTGNVYWVMSKEGASSWFGGSGVSGYKIAAMKINDDLYNVPYPTSGVTISASNISSFSYNCYLFLPYGSELGWGIQQDVPAVYGVRRDAYNISNDGFYLSKDYEVTLYYYK